MSKLSVKEIHPELNRPDEVFELAAELFRVMSEPMRLKIPNSFVTKTTMNCLITAWTAHESELRGWLFEVARNTLADFAMLDSPH